VCVILALTTSAAHAAVELPRVFSDNAVLQREVPVPIWGKADAGEIVTVHFGAQKKSVTADAAGRWRVTLDPLPVSNEPAELRVVASNTITLRKVLVGDVWLCSGQSNMEYPMKRPEKYRGPPAGEPDPANDALKVADHPGIRLFKVQKVLSPDDVTTTGWQLCGGESLEKFSAAAFFFARSIQSEVRVPIGLIDSSWGGSRIELWTPADAYAKHPAFKNAPTTRPLYIDGAPAGKYYDRMIKPLAPFALRGFLWYQGESNLIALDFETYDSKCEALIQSWRSAWGNDKLPFYFVQLAPYAYANRKQDRPIAPEMLGEFRELQTKTLRVPHTGMVVTTDLVEHLGDIHPCNKWEVGRRLALVALADTYGRKDVVASGPTMKSVEFADNRAVVRFESVASGIAARDGKPLTGFELAGEDGAFKPATAVVRGVDSLEVTSADVPKPRSIRFAWHERSQPNLVGGTGLPAVPFRFNEAKRESK
jgi:sialate O-acetylesterase